MWRKMLTLIVLLPVFAFAQDLFFSEYLEGSSNNKALEIYNGTGSTVDLSAYAVLRFNNGATADGDTSVLAGSLADGDVYVIGNSGAWSEILAVSDTTGTATYYNGDDYVALAKDANSDGVFDQATEVLDAIGVFGTDPGSSWDVAGVAGATNEQTLIRKSSVVAGNTDWTSSAGDGTSSEWYVLEQNFYTDLGYHGTAAVKFIVDASMDTASHAGFGLKGSFTSAGVYDTGWGGGGVHVEFADADNDSIWEAVMHFTPDGGANNWEWGLTDENGDWIDGNWQFQVVDNNPLVFDFTYPDPFQTVMVTFRVNSSTVEGLVDTVDNVDLRGTVTQWGPGTDLVNVGGDYWELTLELPANTEYQYKYGAQVTDPVDGVVSDYWENDIPGSDYQGDNRTFSLTGEDLVLDLDYLGSGPDNNLPPYTATADTVDIYLRVNMEYNADFNPATDVLSVVGHFPHASNGNMWSPGTYQLEREGEESNYWGFHLKLAQGYIDTVDQVSFDGNAAGLHMYRFAIGTDWNNSENLSGAYVEGNENRALVLTTGLQDTTVQWVFWNDQGAEPFEGETALVPFTLTTDVSNAVTANGFTLGDTLIVKYGYGGTATGMKVDTLSQVPMQYTYTLALDTLLVDPSRGWFYQYYRIKNGTEYRETYFNFDYAGDDQALAERRYHVLDGATTNSSYTISDDVDSRVDSRRMPIFRNTDELGEAVTVTYTVDMRPAYYQVLSGTTLEDVQGTIDVSVADSVLSWGVWINGPATGEWTGWGGTLAGTTENMMHDDGATGGDLVAGDSVFSVQFAYEATDVVGQEFKFGIRGGDNESGYGLNHIENIDVDNPVVASFWGSINPVFYSAWDFDSNTPLAIEENDVAMPTVFSLGDNYPNPFNPTTQIEFTLPYGSEVTLNIFNILGQQVATLHNGYAKPGTYTASWNGRNMHGELVPSGVYLYELDAGAYYHSVKKMTLLK